MQVTDILGTDAAHYPLTLVSSVDERLNLKAKYLPELFEIEDVHAIVDRVERVLDAVLTDSARLDEATRPAFLRKKFDVYWGREKRGHEATVQYGAR